MGPVLQMNISDRLFIFIASTVTAYVLTSYGERVTLEGIEAKCTCTVCPNILAAKCPALKMNIGDRLFIFITAGGRHSTATTYVHTSHGERET